MRIASGGAPGRERRDGRRDARRRPRLRPRRVRARAPVPARDRATVGEATSRRSSATPARMIAPPTTCSGRIGSPRKMAAMTTASGGTSDCKAVTRVGPSDRTPWKTTTFASAGGEHARVEDRRARSPGPTSDRSRSRRELRRCRPGPCTIVPPTIAHVVVTSGEWRRRMPRAERGVDRPADGRGSRVRRVTRSASPSSRGPDAGGDDQRDPEEREQRADATLTASACRHRWPPRGARSSPGSPR